MLEAAPRDEPPPLRFWLPITLRYAREGAGSEDDQRLGFIVPDDSEPQPEVLLVRSPSDKRQQVDQSGDARSMARSTSLPGTALRTSRLRLREGCGVGLAPSYADWNSTA